MTDKKKKDLITPEFRVSFAQVFEPKQIDGEGDFKYSLTLLFTEDTDLSALKKAAVQAAKDKWGDNLPKNLKMPFLKGNEQDTIHDGYKDMIFIRTSSKQPIGVVKKQDGAIVDIIDRTEFYSGCYAVAGVNAYAWEHKAGKKGVSFGIQNVMKIKDGEPFSSRPKAQDQFAEFVTEADGDSSDETVTDEELEKLCG